MSARIRETSPLLSDKAYNEPSIFTAEGLLVVEMEAAALYALAEARRLRVVCFAVVTNTMAQGYSDFDKGEARGAADALAVVTRV